MRVLFVAEQGDAPSAYYRAHLPAKGLRQRGIDADVTSVLVQNERGKLVGWDGQKLLPVPTHIVCRRMTLPGGQPMLFANEIRQARSRGQQVWMDVDDDAWNLPDWNPAAQWIHAESLPIWEADMLACDGVIASTDALAQSVNKHVTGSVFVCRSGIDTSIYLPREPVHDPIRLAWMGTTHYRGPDLQTVVPALREALDGRFGEVEFWQLGRTANSPSIHEILGPKFPVQVHDIDWVPIERLPTILAQVDCAIVPMEDIPFNRARSYTTGLAWCAAGVPFVASNMPEYQELPCVLANDHQEWVAYIRSLVHGLAPPFTSEYVADNFSPKLIASQYVELFR